MGFLVFVLNYVIDVNFKVLLLSNLLLSLQVSDLVTYQLRHSRVSGLRNQGSDGCSDAKAVLSLTSRLPKWSLLRSLKEILRLANTLRNLSLVASGSRFIVETRKEG